MVKNLSAVRETRAQPLSQKTPWRERWQPLQCSCLGNPTDGRLQSMGSQSTEHDYSDLAFTRDVLTIPFFLRVSIWIVPKEKCPIVSFLVSLSSYRKGRKIRD